MRCKTTLTMSTATLISQDGDERNIPFDLIRLSPTLSAMFDGPFSGSSGSVKLDGIETRVLDKLIEYLEYKKRRNVAGEEFDEEFEIPTEMSLELLLAADYLGV